MHITPEDLKRYNIHSCDLGEARKYMFSLYVATGGDPDVHIEDYSIVNVERFLLGDWPHQMTFHAQIVGTGITREVVMFCQYDHAARGAKVDLTGEPHYDVKLMEIAAEACALHRMYDRVVRVEES